MRRRSRLHPFQEWLAKYERAWHERMDRVDDYLSTLQREGDALTFRDQAGRDHMSRFDGLQAKFDNVEDFLRSLRD